jgi:hypothetical protein
MKPLNNQNQCDELKSRQRGLFGSLKMRLLGKLDNHIAHCEKCQQRLAATNRVEAALMLMKTQPQKTDLLSRANTRVLNNLNHALREDAKSDGLKTARPETNRIERMRPVFERILNTAACLFVICLIKTGMTSSFLDYQNQGQTAIENYYARNLDSQTFDELFGSDSSAG